MLAVLFTVSVWSASVGEWACWPSADPQWSSARPNNCSDYEIQRGESNSYSIQPASRLYQWVRIKEVIGQLHPFKECYQTYTLNWQDNSHSAVASPVPTLDSVWVTPSQRVVWDETNAFDPDGMSAYRIKLPGCVPSRSPWQRLRGFMTGDSSAVQIVYEVLWTLMLGGWIYAGARTEWYTKRKLDALLTAFGLLVAMLCVATSTANRLFWWSVLAALAAALAVWGPMFVQLASNGRWGGQFMLPTQEKGFRLDVAVQRALLPIGMLFVLAVVASE